jgi:hypothetical protein
MDADGGQRLADFVKLEGFDYGDNELHVQAFISQIPNSGRAVICVPYKSGIFLREWHKKFAGGSENNCRGGYPLGSLPLLAGDTPPKCGFIARGLAGWAARCNA